MNEDIVYCAYKNCSNVKCSRFHKKAPQNKLCSWFAVRPRDNGICDYFLNEKEKRNYENHRTEG